MVKVKSECNTVVMYLLLTYCRVKTYSLFSSLNPASQHHRSMSGLVRPLADGPEVSIIKI